MKLITYCNDDDPNEIKCIGYNARTDPDLIQIIESIQSLKKLGVNPKIELPDRYKSDKYEWLNDSTIDYIKIQEIPDDCEYTVVREYNREYDEYYGEAILALPNLALIRSYLQSGDVKSFIEHVKKVFSYNFDNFSNFAIIDPYNKEREQCKEMQLDDMDWFDDMNEVFSNIHENFSVSKSNEND